ncbi:MAG: entericidin A/B family lipoprotein [Leptothrix sp. (in: b-proteobacteria)]
MKSIVMLMAVVAGVLLAGCNTVEGLGKDLRNAGEKIEDAAKKK